MTAARMRGIVVLALAAGGGVCALVLASEHQEAEAAFAIFGPAVGWGFLGTGLYAWHREPQNRTGALMVLLGFAWLLSTLESANAALPYTIGLTVGGLWGSLFLHLGMSFPTGRLRNRFDRGVVIAGYLIFPLAFVPGLLFSGPQELDCSACPDNVLLIRRDEDLAGLGMAFGGLLYGSLFLVALVRATQIWRDAGPLERLQLTPVYVSALLTFLLVTVARAGAGDAAWWAAFIAAWLTPFAFLGGLLRRRISRLVEELHASRARIVEAGDAERRRLERDLHDGAQSRLVALSMLLRSARMRADDDPDLAELLDRAHDELQTSLAELRELARGIHPAVLTERGLEPALQALVSRIPLPVTLEAPTDQRLPGPVESAAYFVVSEALANVAKYAQAAHATVAVRHLNGTVTVEVTDDGVGGADAAQGSGLRGLADRVAALDGTLSIESPAGRGTRLQARIPYGPRSSPAKTWRPTASSSASASASGDPGGAV
jgi:signal transduction histidine kinase